MGAPLNVLKRLYVNPMNLLAFLSNAENTVSYAAGQTIFQEGDTADNMYVVLEGASGD